MQVKAKVGSCTVWCCRHSPQNRELVITGGFSFKFISMIIIIMTSMIMIIIDWTKWEIQMFLMPKHRSGCGNSEFTRVQIPRQGFLTFQMLPLFLLFLHCVFPVFFIQCSFFSTVCCLFLLFKCSLLLMKYSEEQGWPRSPGLSEASSAASGFLMC